MWLSSHRLGLTTIQVVTQKANGSSKRGGRKEEERRGKAAGRKEVYNTEELSQRSPRTRPQGRLAMEKGKGKRSVNQMHFGQSNGTG